MLKYEEGSVEQHAIIESFKSTGSHVVRYSSHECSGIWSDLCIEQTLMRTSKSNGGLSGGRFRNGESAHRCWVQTLSHLSLINRLSQKVASTSKNIHRDLALAQRLADEQAIGLVNNWLEEMQPFDGSNTENILIPFSTGFISKNGDGINPEKAREVGRKIQLKLDGKVPTETLERKMKVKSLAELRKNGLGSDATTPVHALKYFNRLVIFAQRESDLEISLGQHEMTPIPMALVSEKDQLMYEGDKATFVQKCLKDNVMPVNTNTQKIDTFVLDSGWLLHQNKWVKGETWLDIIDGYVQLVKHQSKHANNVIVVFDGYESSMKDHTHRRRKKHFCHDINRENTPYTSKEKFLSNSNNKTELISKLAEALEIANVITVCCRDDADTAIVRECLQHSLLDTVEVRAEDADILMMFIITTRKNTTSSQSRLRMGVIASRKLSKV